MSYRDRLREFCLAKSPVWWGQVVLAAKDGAAAAKAEAAAYEAALIELVICPVCASLRLCLDPAGDEFVLRPAGDLPHLGCDHLVYAWMQPNDLGVGPVTHLHRLLAENIERDETGFSDELREWVVIQDRWRRASAALWHEVNFTPMAFGTALFSPEPARLIEELVHLA